MKEIIDELNENGEVIGAIDKDIAHKEGRLHKSIHLWIINDDGEVLLQYRCGDKRLYPNTWDVSVGGHVSTKENSVDALVRETKEELGIDIEENELIYTGMQKGNTAFINSFIVKKDIDLSEITLQKEEVSKAEWDSYEEVEEKYNNAEFVPHWWEYIKNDIKKYFN